MSEEKCLLQVQQHPKPYSVLFSEQMANLQDTMSTALVPAETLFMRSVTIPFQAPNHPPVNHKRSMTEFKIDYQTRRGSKGKDIVYKVYLPSAYKGYVIMVENNDATSPGVDDLPLGISREAEKSMREFQESSAEDFRDLPVQLPKRKSIEQRVVEPKWLTKFNKVNGLVSPSLLEPGQPPIKSPWVRRRDYASINTRVWNKHCPICGDCFSRNKELKIHFVLCVHRNGNPQGYYWDGRLNNERRIGKEIAELYCRRGKEWGLDPQISTSDTSSDDSYQTCSYEPSKSCSDSESSSSRSPAVAPSLRKDPNPDTVSSAQRWTHTDNGEGNGLSRRWDQKVADWDLETLQVSIAGRADTSPEAARAQPSEQLLDIPAHTLSLKHEASVGSRDWTTTPETPVGIKEASRHDSIHGRFDAVHTTPKTAALTLTGQRHDAISNAYSLPTPLTARGFIAGRSPGQSPDNPICLFASPAKDTNRQWRPHLAPPLSGAKKHWIPCEPSPLAQSPKRQRLLPLEPANLPQAKTATGPSRRFEQEGLQSLPQLIGDSTLRLSRNRPTFGENMDVNNVGERQYKGVGLRINTQVAESAAPLPPEIDLAHGEKLIADYIRTHKAVRGELDKLTHELCAANERANMAELRARKAENLVYQANSANSHKQKELQTQGQKYRILEIKFEEQYRRSEFLETRCKAFSQMIDQLKREPRQERQRQMSAFYQRDCRAGLD